MGDMHVEWGTYTRLAIGKPQRAFMADPEAEFSASGAAGRGGDGGAVAALRA